MIPHMGGVGGFKYTCEGLFTGFADQLPELEPDNPPHAGALRCRQGVIPDLMLDAASIDLPLNVAKTLRGRNLADMKPSWHAQSRIIPTLRLPVSMRMATPQEPWRA